jgi:hypothetical protein
MAQIKLANGQPVKAVKVWDGTQWKERIGRVFVGGQWVDFISYFTEFFVDRALKPLVNVDGGLLCIDDATLKTLYRYSKTGELLQQRIFTNYIHIDYLGDNQTILVFEQGVGIHFINALDISQTIKTISNTGIGTSFFHVCGAGSNLYNLARDFYNTEGTKIFTIGGDTFWSYSGIDYASHNANFIWMVYAWDSNGNKRLATYNMDGTRITSVSGVTSLGGAYGFDKDQAAIIGDYMFVIDTAGATSYKEINKRHKNTPAYNSAEATYTFPQANAYAVVNDGTYVYVATNDAYLHKLDQNLNLISSLLITGIPAFNYVDSISCDIFNNDKGLIYVLFKTSSNTYFIQAIKKERL